MSTDVIIVIVAACVILGCIGLLLWYLVTGFIERRDQKYMRLGNLIDNRQSMNNVSARPNVIVGSERAKGDSRSHEEMTKSLKAIQGGIDNLMDGGSRCISKLNTLLRKIEELESDQPWYDAMLEDFHRERDCERDEKRKLSEANSSLQKVYDESRSMYDQLLAEHVKLDDEYRDLKKEHQSVCSNLATTQGELEVRTEELRKMTQERDAMRDKRIGERHEIRESLRRYICTELTGKDVTLGHKIEHLVNEVVQTMIPPIEDDVTLGRMGETADLRTGSWAGWHLVSAILEVKRAVGRMNAADAVNYVHYLSEPVMKYVDGNGGSRPSELQEWANAMQSLLSGWRPNDAEWTKFTIYVPDVGPNCELMPEHVRWEEPTMRGYMRELVRWKASAYDKDGHELCSELAVARN